MSDDTNVYYYRNGLNPDQLNNPTQYLTTRTYLNRLTVLQSFSTCIIFVASLTQAVAIGLTEWFVLNVNEYIPTSKGGLWQYCYISSVGIIGDYSCSKYEELPNFAVFVNSRLYDSRILLLCSTGFCILILLIEIFGVLCLTLAESRGDLIDTIIAKNSDGLRFEEKNLTIPDPPLSPKIKIKSHQSSKIQGQEDTNSARFTTSIIVNTSPQQSGFYKTVKPTGYFAYLSIALVSLVGSVMEFILKVSGFALFDAYINKLLSLNTVFIAYRSYSYWMVIISMGLVVFFWLFKVFTTRYVINLTKNLVQPRPLMIPSIYTDSADLEAPYDQYLPNYTTVSRIFNDNDKMGCLNREFETCENQQRFLYDMNDEGDYVSTGSCTSRQESNSNSNSNYYHEYLQIDGNRSLNTEYSPSLSQEKKSTTSVVRF